MKEVHKYIIAYNFIKEDGTGSGSCHIEVKHKIITFKEINELVEQIKKVNNLKIVGIGSLIYLGKGAAEIINENL